jgi:hypothetical protein
MPERWQFSGLYCYRSAKGRSATLVLNRFDAICGSELAGPPDFRLSYCCWTADDAAITVATKTLRGGCPQAAYDSTVASFRSSAMLASLAGTIEW